MADEIERKFLIEELPEDLDYSIGQIIHQGYFTDEDASPELRVRSKGENYYLTAKS
ncbi:MAG: hypothetical protein HRT89_10065 [Lentisphaeria bacterium]|nr:hypothetical protein [Lentisphaeria bacterium]